MDLALPKPHCLAAFVNLAQEDRPGTYWAYLEP
jgi:hypothetical protein